MLLCASIVYGTWASCDHTVNTVSTANASNVLNARGINQCKITTMKSVKTEKYMEH